MEAVIAEFLALPEGDRPFYNQAACLMRNTSEHDPATMPILPETVIMCLSNLSSYEHLDEDDKIVPRPAEWCVQYLSRVLRESPETMQDAIIMQCGTETQQYNRETMRIARGIVSIAATQTGENVPMITVSDLREIMKKYHPSLYQYIPSEKRALANWLNKAGLKFLGQRRGKSKSAGMKAFETWAESGNYYPEQ